MYKDKMKELQSQPHMSGKKQKTLDSIVSHGAQSRAGPRIEYYARTSSRHRELTEGVVEMIAECMLPLNIVDMPGFRKRCEGSRIKRLPCTLHRQMLCKVSRVEVQYMTIQYDKKEIYIDSAKHTCIM